MPNLQKKGLQILDPIPPTRVYMIFLIFEYRLYPPISQVLV
jgi:hypothetical protein